MIGSLLVIFTPFLLCPNASFCLITEPCQQILPGMALYVCRECAKRPALSPITWDEIDNKVAPPWAAHQIESLEAYQHSPTFLPFICQEQCRLVAREDGLFCKHCAAHQTWTYDWTLDWSWKLLEPPEASGTPAKSMPPNSPQETSVQLDLPEPEEDEH